MNLFISEMKKMFYETFTYYPDLIVSVLTHILLFFFITYGRENYILVLVSYLFWIISSGILSEASINISTEKQLGTLQNLLIKPYSILHIIIVKIIIWLIFSILKLIVFLFILNFFYSVREIFDMRILVILSVTSFGIMGISLFLGALTLVFTKVASFEALISFLLLFISGGIVKIPNYIIYTNPISLGTHCAMKVLENKIILKDFSLLVIISLCYLLLGIVIFNLLIKNSKQFSWTY